MRKLWLCLVLFWLAPWSMADEAYFWVDKDGVMHFSDSPAPGSEAIDLPNLEGEAPPPEVQNTAAENTANDSADPVNDDASSTVEEPVIPLKITMVSPQHDDTIRSNRGFINILIETNRPLGIGEQFQLMFDGRRYGAPQTQLSWKLKNIDRGAHTISVQAIESGKLIASTPPITVFLHRASAK